MSRIAYFLVLLILGLAGLTWLASYTVERTVADWSRRDLNQRAQVVIHAAKPSLVANWFLGSVGLRGQLDDLVQDERFVAAAACGTDLTLLASTPAFPEDLNCRDISAHLGDPQVSTPRFWDRFQILFGGSVHVSTVSVQNGNQPLGFVVLVQDMSFLGRRSKATRTYLIIAFGFLALAAAAVTIAVARFSRKGWSAELRNALRGRSTEKAEFQPILRDVHELVDRPSWSALPRAVRGTRAA